MRKLIKVEQRHINRGVREDADSCPVARACNAAKLGYEFSAKGETLDFKRGGDYYLPTTAPRSVQRFIKRFDKLGRKAVKPFNFYLELPEND